VVVFFNLDRNQKEYDHTTYLLPDNLDIEEFWENILNRRLENVGYWSYDVFDENNLRDLNEELDVNIKSISDFDYQYGDM
jgi:hypothetical protein